MHACLVQRSSEPASLLGAWAGGGLTFSVAQLARSLRLGQCNRPQHAVLPKCTARLAAQGVPLVALSTILYLRPGALPRRRLSFCALFGVQEALDVPLPPRMRRPVLLGRYDGLQPALCWQRRAIHSVHRVRRDFSDGEGLLELQIHFLDLGLSLRLVQRELGLDRLLLAGLSHVLSLLRVGHVHHYPLSQRVAAIWAVDC